MIFKNIFSLKITVPSTQRLGLVKLCLCGGFNHARFDLLKELQFFDLIKGLIWLSFVYLKAKFG